jgi:phosphoenolpyruvate-protein kinase (PTS system EI component)
MYRGAQAHQKELEEDKRRLGEALAKARGELAQTRTTKETLQARRWKHIELWQHACCVKRASSKVQVQGQCTAMRCSSATHRLRSNQYKTLHAHKLLRR